MIIIAPAAFSATYRNSTPEELREVIRRSGGQQRLPRAYLVQLFRDYPALRTPGILENCSVAIATKITRLILAHPAREMCLRWSAMRTRRSTRRS